MTSVARADLGRLHVIVPLRSLATGKARLGGAIDAEERETLIRGMLLHTLDVLCAWPVPRRIHLVSADPVLLRETARHETLEPILQRGEGLNDALRLGRSHALEDGATAVLMVPADLPYLSAEPLELLLDAADAALTAGSGTPIVVVAPSDARAGTNGLLLSPPDVIEPCFGTRSLEAHMRAAAAAGASLQVVTDPRLGFDLDTPDDLELLEPSALHELTRLGSSFAGASVE